MAYVKNIWVDQDVERPKTYEVTNNQDGSITLTDSFGLVTELGTPVNEVNMNHIEDGIDGCAIRKHNLTETFNLGEWVLGGTGNDEGIYKSLVSNNVGNAISDDTKWEKVEMGGGGRNIGEIVASTIPLVDAGLHLLDGALIQGAGSYSAFVDYIAGLVADYPDLFDTEANWQSAVAQYGSCGKFVYDSVSNTVRLPKITNILQATNSASTLGNITPAGLPNITGVAQINSDYGDNYTGAFYKGVSTSVGRWYSAGNGAVLNFDASRSNSIYGNSTTVQPQTTKVFYYIVVATDTKTDIQVDIDEIATDLNGKADVDLTNCTKPHIVETYRSGTSWKRVYSDGWCEQGGIFTNTANQQSVALLQNYADTNYCVQLTILNSTAGTSTSNIKVNSKSTSSFIAWVESSERPIMWFACGYIS